MAESIGKTLIRYYEGTPQEIKYALAAPNDTIPKEEWLPEGWKSVPCAQEYQIFCKATTERPPCSNLAANRLEDYCSPIRLKSIPFFGLLLLYMLFLLGNAQYTPIQLSSTGFVLFSLMKLIMALYIFFCLTFYLSWFIHKKRNKKPMRDWHIRSHILEILLPILLMLALFLFPILFFDPDLPRAVHLAPVRSYEILPKTFDEADDALSFRHSPAASSLYYYSLGSSSHSIQYTISHIPSKPLRQLAYKELCQLYRAKPIDPTPYGAQQAADGWDTILLYSDRIICISAQDAPSWKAIQNEMIPILRTVDLDQYK